MSFWQQVIDGIEIVTMEVILAVAPIVILFVLMNDPFPARSQYGLRSGRTAFREYDRWIAL